MIAFPLTLLALAAGTYLLLKARKELMGKMFEGLAWLIIVLSILYLLGISFMGFRHRMERRMMMEHGMMMNHMGWHGQDCCSHGRGMDCCGGMHGGGMNMSCSGGSCCEGPGMSCGAGGHDMSCCDGREMGGSCMGDSAKGKDGKGACCMGGKTEEKPKSGK